MTESVLIMPRRGKHEPIMPAAILALGELNWNFLREPLEALGAQRQEIIGGTLMNVPGRFSCAGQIFGAPAAVVVLENLIALGARLVLAFGCAGSLQPSLRIGDILLPTSALAEEGTSAHYFPHEKLFPASNEGTAFLRRHLQEAQLSWHEGTVWTTDAPYRETISKVQTYQAAQIQAVEMELSALFAVARFRAVELAALVVISDEVFTLHWRPGFVSKVFQTRGASMAKLLTQWLQEPPA